MAVTNEALERYIAKLEELRRSVCEYGPDADRCDCKFYMPRQDFQNRFGLGTEVTGCPELRVLIAMMRGQIGGELMADLWWSGRATTGRLGGISLRAGAAGDNARREEGGDGRR